MEYANIKTGREYAFVNGTDVVTAVCTGKRCGVVLLGDVPVGEQNVYPKTQADSLREKVAAEIAAQKAVELVAKKVKKPRGRSAESKAVKADALYVQLVAEGKSRKDIIFEFMDKLGLTISGASTYYSNSRARALKG